MELLFYIQTIDSMVAEFQVEGKSISIRHSSFYGDKFQELINEFFLIYNSRNGGEEISYPYSFDLTWYDDAVNYTWSVSASSVSSGIGMEIFKRSPEGENYRVSIVKRTFDFAYLFESIYFSLKRMLADFGFSGYKENWEVGNFPIYEYIKL